MKTHQRGLGLYVVMASVALGGVAIAGAVVWDKGRIKSADAAGYARAKQEVKVEASAALNRSLINQRELILTLNDDLTIAINDYTRTKAQLDAAHALAWSAGQRVRNVATTGDELDRRAAAASRDALRTFGTGAFRTAQACRDVVAEAGYGAGGLVGSSASAHFEHARAEGLMKFSMPKSPFTKTKD